MILVNIVSQNSCASSRMDCWKATGMDRPCQRVNSAGFRTIGAKNTIRCFYWWSLPHPTRRYSIPIQPLVAPRCYIHPDPSWFISVHTSKTQNWKPMQSEQCTHCTHCTKVKSDQAGGEDRVIVQPGLTAIQSLFHRWHIYTYMCIYTGTHHSSYGRSRNNWTLQCKINFNW